MVRQRYTGQRSLRREDARLLTGTGQFVGDIRLPGMLDVALVRSQRAHGRIVGVDTARARSLPGVEAVLGGADLPPAVQRVPGAQVKAPAGWAERVRHHIDNPAQPVLAFERVRYVGEPVAAVVAGNIHQAMDAAEQVGVAIEALPVLHDLETAAEERTVLLHPDLGSNVLAHMAVEKGDPDGALARAPHRIRRRIVHHRYAAMPLECRAVVADYDRRTDSLTVWSATQVVHWVQAAVAAALGMTRSQVRVIAPDVGGGFGVKGHVYPEELLVAYLARRLGAPVRWLESRSEHFLGATHSRDTVHEVEVGFDDHGRILALRDACLIDSGAFSPVGPGVAYNTTAHLLGPYVVENFAAATTVVCTNKAPNAPYRGAGRPEAVQVMERIMDGVAASISVEPAEIRLRNMIRPEQMPYSVGLPYRDGQPIVYDSGDYPAALRRALAELGGVERFRQRQRDARAKGRLLGLGIGCYTEGTGVGPFEGARVEVDPSGRIVVALGACAQGQGHETVFAQLCADLWQVDLDEVLVTVGDTGKVDMGYGTVGSRSAVTASMALSRASEQVRTKVLAIAAELLEASPGDLELREGGVSVAGAPALRVSLSEVARAAQPGWQSRRPEGMEAGLSAECYYEPPTVTWSYAANAAIVEVDPDTGQVRVERYVEVHDAGVLLNPALADGQVTGGIVQGLGGALHEAIVYDADGQLRSGSFLDYAMPRATDVPPITVIHQQSPSPLNPLGIKGLGEGGAIAPPVVIANALDDALRGSGVEFDSLPLRAPAIRDALQRLAR